jgi:hypothetical protein
MTVRSGVTESRILGEPAKDEESRFFLFRPSFFVVEILLGRHDVPPFVDDVVSKKCLDGSNNTV